MGQIVTTGKIAATEDEVRYRALLDASLDGVIVVDEAGHVVEWNPAAEDIFGWQRAEMLGQDLTPRLLPERLRAANAPGLAQFLETNEGLVQRRRLETEALRRDGSEFSAELTVSRLPGEEPVLLVATVRDISESRRAQESLRAAKERAEIASRAKDDFLAALSHELRTPLTPVLMTAAALREDDRLPTDVREQLGMLERNIGLEARLIDDLLDLTRVTRGKLQLREERCEAHSLISLATEIVRNEAQVKSVTLELELNARRTGLHGDPARLQQVFWNLLRNAIKFTPAGGRVVVRTQDEEAEERLLVIVRDSGIGLAPEAVERIFQPFEQGGRGNDHRFGGLGLGLTIARAIVELHGGSIRAESGGQGLGASFVVELPGAGQPPSGITLQHGVTTAPTGLPSLRLLLVEDHEATLQVLARLLTRAGHTVSAARTVTSALEIAAVGEFDGVVSDLGLPDGTGLELMMRLRQQTPGLRGIALSGYGMEDDMRRSLEAGFITHLVKPIVFEDLSRALRELAPAGAN